jgi:small subunit ribosomal protein S21
MKRAAFYEKPYEKAAREKSEAIRRARKQAIREGLIAAPVKKPNDRRPTRTVPSVSPTSPKLP